MIENAFDDERFVLKGLGLFRWLRFDRLCCVFLNSRNVVVSLFVFALVYI